jgi:general secretion pathway protein I
LCRPANPEGRGIAGFTLIEALAALAVMGAGLAAIGSLASSSVHAGLYAERHLAEIETARKIIAGMPPREALPVGRLTGALDAHDWRIDSTLIGAPAAVGDALWTPQRIEVLVQSPSGAMLRVDTIRLRRQATKK